jgi:hypothetical protein
MMMMKTYAGKGPNILLKTAKMTFIIGPVGFLH